MSKVSEYTTVTTVVPTAETYLYDPTDPTHPDKFETRTKAANVPSVIKGFADSASIIIGAEVANVRAVTVQLKDADGVNLTRIGCVRLIVVTTAAATALSNGGSTGLAIGANGLIVATITAKKVFDVLTDATGLWTGTYTDTGTDAAFLVVQLPDGRCNVSAAMTNT